MEFEFFGERCAVKHCRQHDYLPFKCDACAGSFCLEHRLPAAHQCAHAPAAAPQPLPCVNCGGVIARLPRGASESTKTAVRRAHARTCTHARARVPVCPVPDCAQRLAAPVACRSCGIEHCVSHRLPENHACIAKKTALNVARKEAVRAARRAPAHAAPVPAGFENSPMHPVGDKKVDGAERVYCEVHFAGELAGRKAVFFFFSRRWRVGRSIDEIAKHAGVPTVVSGRRLQMRTGGTVSSAGVCAMLDGIGEAVRQHTVVYVEYAPAAKSSPATCAAEVSSEAVVEKHVAAAK